jgi:hypothetical protein
MMWPGRCAGAPLAAALSVVLSASAALADGPTVTLSDFSLQFTSLTQAHVRGTVTCRGLKWPGFSGPQTNQLGVGFGLQYPGKTFPVLADWGNSESTAPNTPRVYTAYSGDSKIAAGTAYITRAASLTPLEVEDWPLYYAGQDRVGSTGDDGRPLVFDRTMDFSLLGKPPERYRVLVCLEQSCQAGPLHTVHPFVWIVYGPFRWGQAPPLPGPLTAGVRKQAHFAGGGTGTGVTVGTGGGAGSGAGAGSAGLAKPGSSTMAGIRLMIGGKPYSGAPPRVVNGAAMLPLNGFMQACPFESSYDRATRRLMILGPRTVVMWAGKDVATVGGAQVPLANPPVMVGGEMHIPLRFAVEQLGGSLTWDAATKTMAATFRTPPQ